MRKLGGRWRVSTWLEHWVSTIAVPPHVSENTHAGYRVDVERHLIPGIGAHWLDKLEPENLERLYARIQVPGYSLTRSGVALTTALAGLVTALAMTAVAAPAPLRPGVTPGASQGAGGSGAGMFYTASNWTV